MTSQLSPGSVRQPPSTALIGRAREQNALRERLRGVRAGTGRLILVGGEAGIGKTALVGWLAAEARRQGVLVLTGRCYDLTQAPPYGVWIDALAEIESAGNVAGLPHPLRRNAEPDAVTSQSLLFAEARAFLARLAAERPVVVVLEDLHWSDPASLDLLRDLARGVEKLGVLLAATYRHDALTRQHRLFALLPNLAREAAAERIDLPRFTAGEVRELVASRYALSDADEARLSAYLRARAGGNPFYLTEVLHELETERALQPAGKGWSLGPLEDVGVPPLVRQIIESRLAALDAETQRLLEIAATVGQDPSLDVWQLASGATSDEIARAMERAIEAHLLVETRRSASAEFTHALVRETLYDRQPLRQRRMIHRRVAEILASRPDPPASVIASHFAEADDPRAIDWLTRAGEQALAMYAAQDAVVALTRAQDLAGRFGQELPLPVYRSRAAAFSLLGEFDRARRDHELVLERARAAGNERAEWQALVDLGMLWAERDYERTGRYARAALDLARRIGDEPTIAYSLNRVGNWHVNRDEPDMALPLHEEALSIFRAIGDRAGIADTLDFLGMASYLDADFHHAASYAEEAIPLFRELDDRQRLSSCLVVLAVSGGDLTWIAAPPFREASYWIRSGEEALAVARDIGWPAGEAFALFCVSTVVAARGDLGRALRNAEEGLEVAERIGHEQWVIAARQGLGAVLGELFDTERGIPVLEEALAAARASRSPLWTNTVVATLVPLLVAAGELARADAVLGTVPGPRTSHLSLSQRQVRFAQAELILARGDADLALAMADELAATRPHPTAGDALPQIMTLRGNALARMRRTAEAEAAYAVARDGASLLGYRPLLWRIDQARGNLFSAQGRSAEARAAYLSARATVDEMAATIGDPVAREAFRARAMARLSPDAAMEHGALVVDALSPREREVLLHLAEGKSDREIAAALSISPRTVMRHVTSILDKLGVSSRTAAATLAIRNKLV